MKRIVGLLIVLALFAVGSVMAQPRGPRQKRDGMKLFMLKQYAEELKLTDEQQDKLDDMMVDFKIERIDIDADIEKESVILKSLMRDDDASDTEVYRQIDKVADLKAQSQKMMFDHRNTVQDLLTDSQREKLQELRKEKMHRFKERKDGRKGFGKAPRGHRIGKGSQCDGHGPRWHQDGDVEYEVEIRKDVIESEDGN